MAIEVDMHFHSKFSDGSYMPEELVEKLKQTGLKGGVLTDHESWHGSMEFLKAAKNQELLFTSGAEVSVMHQEFYMHILLYGIEQLMADETASPILENNWCLTENRTRKMLEEFRASGLAEATLDHVRKMTQSPGPFIHFTKIYKFLALSRGITYDEAREVAKSKGIKKPDFEYAKLTPAATLISIARKVKAKPVLAHVFDIKQIKKETDLVQMEIFLNRLLDDLQPAGLFGLEAFHTKHKPIHAEIILKVSEQRGLLVTGGSDFHGDVSGNIKLGDRGVSAEAFQKFIRAT